jgi:MFS family permease
MVLVFLSIPMFASYFFDDIFSSVSHIFSDPGLIVDLGWNAAEYGSYGGAYSILCVCGGLIICGMLLDKWGVRFTGSLFVGLMVGGAALVTYAISGTFAHSGFCSWLQKWMAKPSLTLAIIGCSIFGLGSEIAGVAVTRSIAKWFKGKEMAMAMGLQLALARLGTATALISVPFLVNATSGRVLFSQTIRPAQVGMILMVIAVAVWALFLFVDAKFDRQMSARIEASSGKPVEKDEFKFSDIGKILSNKYYILISLLCVFFYCCIISFRRFATAIIIPRFDIDQDLASTMVALIPFCTMVFTPIFGYAVDRKGRGTRLMLLGSVMVLVAHLIVAFAPRGMAWCGYVGIGLLGIGYALVPAAMWPSVPKIIPEKNLGTAYSLVYWIQNIGLLVVPIFVGKIIDKTNARFITGEASLTPQNESLAAYSSAVNAEYLFIALGVAAVIVALVLCRESDKRPDLELDAPNKK